MWTGAKVHVPLLVMGHPRCGTTSASDICKSVNLDVGIERIGKHGIASWMLAVNDVNPYGFDVLARSRRNLRWDAMAFVVRDLKDAAPSVILENRFEPPSFRFRQIHILKQRGIDIGACTDELSAAVLSIAGWMRIILAQNPAFWFRVEDQQAQFRDFLLQMFKRRAPEQSEDAAVRSNADKPYFGEKRAKPVLVQEDWDRLSDAVKAEAAWYCSTFGYAIPFDADATLPFGTTASRPFPAQVTATPAP